MGLFDGDDSTTGDTQRSEPPDDDVAVEATGLFDSLTDIDDLIRAANSTLDAINTRSEVIANGVETLATNLTDATAGEIGSGLREFPYPMAAEVPPNTSRNDPVAATIEPDYDATITTVYLGFPAGTQQTVGVRLSDGGGEVWIPRGGQRVTSDGTREPQYIAEDDVTVAIDLNVAVDEDNTIQAQFVSTDPSNSHYVTVTPILRERPSGEGGS
jgi:hypothetical protein